jgi:hypothetical protein
VLYFPSLEYVPIARRCYYLNCQSSSQHVDEFSCSDNGKVRTYVYLTRWIAVRVGGRRRRGLSRYQSRKTRKPLDYYTLTARILNLFYYY